MTTTLHALDHHVSWGSILAGVFIALTITTLLNFLGIGLNLIAFSPDKEALSAIGFFSLIWIILTSIASMYIGGWIAGRMSGFTTTIEGATHGVVVCGVSIFLTFALVAFVGSVAGIMSSTVASNLVSNENLVQHDNSTLEMQAVAGDIRNAEQNYLSSDSNQNMTGNNQNLSQQNVKKTAEKAGDITGTAALMLFVLFLISAIASAAGGVRGAISLEHLASTRNHRG